MAEEIEITTRNVLLECLEYERMKWKWVSKKRNTLEPARGWEKEWNAQRRKCEILQGLIQALESEPVRRELAKWQREKAEEEIRTGLAEAMETVIQQPARSIEEAMRFTEETKASTGCK